MPLPRQAVLTVPRPDATILGLAIVLHLLAPPAARAQSLEPRLYIPLPVGINILIASYTNSSGDVLVDGALPITDFHVSSNGATLAYARSFSLVGRTAQLQAVAPFVVAQASAIVAGQDTSRQITGLADPLLRLAVNLKGGPARRRSEMAGVRFGTIIGASLTAALPLGQYDDDRVLNIGANRWTIKPELAIVQPLGRRWAVEAYAGVSLFSHNTAFLETSTATQKPLFALQGHLIRILGRRGWLALDGTLVTGGETSVDGVVRSTFQRNLRLGATGAYMVKGGHGLRASVSTGFYTRLGGDFTVFSLGYSYAWGG